MKRKRDDPEEGGSGYSWMDTYGDMVTLLLCFFVLLYSFSSMDSAKWQALVGAFAGTSEVSAIPSFDVNTAREEPINQIDPMVNYENREKETQQSKIDAANAKRKEINDIYDRLYASIRTYIDENGLQNQMNVMKTDDAIILRFGEIALFNPGQANILPKSRETMAHMVDIIAQNEKAIKMVSIEGNTDNVPIHNAQFTDNWDLSVKRATNALRLVLSTGKISETKISAIGYGEYQPIDSNATSEGRSRNRRVDFVLKKADLPEAT